MSWPKSQRLDSPACGRASAYLLDNSLQCCPQRLRSLFGRVPLKHIYLPTAEALN